MNLSRSKNFIDEYSATICKVGTITPIENSDFLGSINISGFNLVIRKDQVKEGETVIYCPIETQLNSDFLSKSNLYDMSCRELNSNYSQVQSLLDNNEHTAAKKLVGFFSKYGRVRIIRLRGVISMGFIIRPIELLKWKPNLDISNIDKYLNYSFDTIDNNLFIKVYLPPVKESSKPTVNKRNAKLKLKSRLVHGIFSFHYDTLQLAKYPNSIKPTDIIDISEKIDGTSFIVANIPVLRKLSIIDKLKKLLGFKVPLTEYDIIYSSRNVIKNQYFDYIPKLTPIDLWFYIASKLGSYIEKDMIIYGECFGYFPNTNKLIQKKGNHSYDYGCEKGECKVIIYRIHQGNKEWNISEIVKWINNLEYKGIITDMNILYHGMASNLYPDIAIDENWGFNFVERLKTDKKFLMECDEPSCTPGTPSEGIVIRIEDDPNLEAFKLKSLKYLNLEAGDIDNNIVDIENSNEV